VDEHEWRDRWREFFRPSRVGRRFVVCPPWHDPPGGADDLVLLVDPGQAFGTGAHPSTRLCLRAIERLARLAPPPSSVLDAGCGSGILSAAAALVFGAGCEVTAIDVDPDAVEATTRTLRQNALPAVQARCVPLAAVEGAFDLVLANLQADALIAHRDRLSGIVSGRGWLVLSGLLAAEAGSVAQEFCAVGELRTEYTEDEGEWRAVFLRRP
jgi:ribosomal protein L11 methyltransferase